MKKECFPLLTFWSCSWGYRLVFVARASNPVFFLSVMNRKGYGSVILVICCNGYFGSLRWNQGRDLFGPLNKTIISRVKIFFCSDIICFRFVFYSVKVKMKNPCVVVSDIFIYDGECRAAHHVCHPQRSAQGFDEGGFSRAH